jgi:hypothetical protein
MGDDRKMIMPSMSGFYGTRKILVASGTLAALKGKKAIFSIPTSNPSFIDETRTSRLRPQWRKTTPVYPLANPLHNDRPDTQLPWQHQPTSQE